MNQIISQAIVLSRTNYQEADRILTLLTPHQGKVRALAKGVRKSKSKLAGGVELFSVSEIGYIVGRGELCTLTSARLVTHFESIVKDIDRTMLGYELIKLLNKVTEDHPEPDYFDLLVDVFDSLNQPQLHMDTVKLWFFAQLLRIAGHSPNLRTDALGNSLDQTKAYIFDDDQMAFLPDARGQYTADHIKFLRLALSGNKPRTLQKITSAPSLIPPTLQLIQTILPNHLRT